MRSSVLMAAVCVVGVVAGGVYVFAGANIGVLQTDAAISIDPACLWPVIGGSMNPDAAPAPTSVPIEGCAPTGATVTTDEDGWVRIADEDEDGGQRFTGVRVAQTMDHMMVALHAYDSGGGSGVFSSLVTGTLDAPNNRFTDVRSFGFGDRCNGGLSKTHLAENGRLRVTANMTPWDIMMAPLAELSFEDQWTVGAQRYGAAFNEAPGCAICCSAVTREYEVEGAEMREVGLRYAASDDQRSGEDLLGICLEEAVRDAAGADGLVTGSERDVLNPAIAACVSNANSN